MAKVPSHRDLLVWQKGMELVTTCYRLSSMFPQYEQYCLTSQLRRSAISVPANIAEGKGRGTTGAYVNHLGIAAGSLAELDTHLELSHRLNYAQDDQLEPILAMIDEVGRMIGALRRSLEKGA